MAAFLEIISVKIVFLDILWVYYKGYFNFCSPDTIQIAGYKNIYLCTVNIYIMSNAISYMLCVLCTDSN